MAEGDGAGTGAGTGSTGGDTGQGAGGAGTAGQGTGNTGAGTQSGVGDKGAGSQAGAKSFTQDEVNAMLAKERGTTERRFADYEDLKNKASEFDKLTEAQKSDLQKAQDRAAESERKALQLETDLADTRLRSEVISTAAGKGIVDPVDAFKLLDRSKVEFDKAGEATNIGSLLDDLLKAKPYLSGKPGTGSGEGGPRGGTATEGLTKNQWFHQAARK